MHDDLNLEIEGMEVGGLIEEREILHVRVPSYCVSMSNVHGMMIVRVGADSR